MIIRSQDKKSILNFFNITDLSVNNTKESKYEIIACFPYSIMDDCGYNKIGTYSTEEKAINVLDMIQQEFCDYGENGAFNMPSDEEVEV